MSIGLRSMAYLTVASRSKGRANAGSWTVSGIKPSQYFTQRLRTLRGGEGGMRDEDYAIHTHSHTYTRTQTQTHTLTHTQTYNHSSYLCTKFPKISANSELCMVTSELSENDKSAPYVTDAHR